MKRMPSIMLMLIGLLVLAGSGAALAQSGYQDTGSAEPAATASSETSLTITGSVVSRSGSSLTIATDDGSQMTFTLDQAAAPSEELSHGERVTLQYRQQDGGTNVATQVTRDVSGDSGQPANADAGAAGAHDAGSKMPQTASTLPLVALLGTAALGAAAGLALFGRRAG